MPERETEEPQQPCEHCGIYTVQRLGRWLCEACYQARGSCCTEFEPDEEQPKAQD
jgi:hypothetical protein